MRQSNIEISDLYVAESPTTAMYEVRPFMFDAVNIAKVRVNEPLKIVNIAVDLDLSSNKGATKEMWVMGMIQGAVLGSAGAISAAKTNIETAKEYLKMGFYIGIGGVLTFKNSKLKDIIKDIPLDRIILESKVDENVFR